MYAIQLSNLGIELRGKVSGQHKFRCPKCGENKSDTDLSVNIDTGLYNCKKPRCGWSGIVATNNYQKELPKQYKRPIWKNNTKLSDGIVHWFKGRGISQETLVKMKVTDGPEWMPKMPEGKTSVNTIQFNYLRGQDLINTKYRDGNKRFRLEKDAELIFYNLNALKDTKIISIQEGEIDTLSYIEAGIDYAISVPNGANKSGSVKLEYLDNCWEHFENIEKIIIATDNDEPGIALKNELARRLGIERCYYVDFDDCKDANEYLLKHGKEALRLITTNAKIFPIQGIIFANDVSNDVDNYYDNGLSKGNLIGIEEFDKHISFDDEGAFTIVTGIPNQGKSEFVDFLASILNIKYHWRCGVFSPENFPLKFHIGKLAEKIIGKSFFGEYRMLKSEKDMAKSHINNNFFFIASDDDDFSIDDILEKARILVLKYGIKILIIDPWNKLEHQRDRNEDKSDYISKVLDKIFKFKRKYKLHIFLIAHPTKIKKDKRTGMFEIPNLYDIADSAHFFNKPEMGLTVYRNFYTHKTEVYIQKMKFKHWGTIGKVEFNWDPQNGRYYIHNQNTENWLLNNNIIDKSEHTIITSSNNDIIEF